MELRQKRDSLKKENCKENQNTTITTKKIHPIKKQLQPIKRQRMKHPKSIKSLPPNNL